MASVVAHVCGGCGTCLRDGSSGLTEGQDAVSCLLSCDIFNKDSLLCKWTAKCIYLKCTILYILTYVESIKLSPQSRYWIYSNTPNFLVAPYISFYPDPDHLQLSHWTVFYQSRLVCIFCTFFYQWNHRACPFFVWSGFFKSRYDKSLAYKWVLSESAFVLSPAVSPGAQLT